MIYVQSRTFPNGTKDDRKMDRLCRIIYADHDVHVCVSEQATRVDERKRYSVSFNKHRPSASFTGARNTLSFLTGLYEGLNLPKDAPQ